MYWRSENMSNTIDIFNWYIYGAQSAHLILSVIIYTVYRQSENLSHSEGCTDPGPIRQNLPTTTQDSTVPIFNGGLLLLCRTLARDQFMGFRFDSIIIFKLKTYCLQTPGYRWITLYMTQLVLTNMLLHSIQASILRFTPSRLPRHSSTTSLV